MSQYNHAECALSWPEAYEGTVESAQVRGKQWDIIRAATYYDLPPLLDRRGIWAICIDGLYCLTTQYPIGASRFDEQDWREHMSDKPWVDIHEFEMALERAQTLRRLGYIS
jgi:hypothetical protein